MRNVTALGGHVRVACQVYGTKTGLAVMATAVREAWRNGMESVTTTHSAGVHPPDEKRAMDGSFLWHLLEVLRVGKWAAYVDDFQQRHTTVNIVLKENRKPTRPPVWTELPESEFTETQPMRTRGVARRDRRQW